MVCYVFFIVKVYIISIKNAKICVLTHYNAFQGKLGAF